jgi:putative serine protease PepD
MASAPSSAAQAGPQRAHLPGWVWPVLVVTALVVGLIGGALAAVGVSTTMARTATPVPVATGGAAAAPAPLPVHNGSIAAVAAKLLPSTVQVLANGGAGSGSGDGATGSGFVYDRFGHVITNNHVVAGAAGPGELTVVDNNGKRHAAKIVGRSAVYDLAVLDVQGARRLPPVSIGASHTMRVGDTVVAIGSPLGLSSTVTSGIISALDRPVTTSERNHESFIDAVQTDAAINPGNSGGPLVNMRGQVVGVNSAIATMGQTFGGEAGSIGVGFAIPIEQVQVTAAQILATGHASYPVIGAEVNTAPSRRGARVVAVPSGTPASKAGLRKGDLVVGVDGTRITDGIGLIVAIRTHQPGQTITLHIKRAGHREQLRIRLDAKTG